MPVIISILLVLLIIFCTCYNMMDKWRFRADRQYPYVRKLMDEWETVTLRLLNTLGINAPEVSVAGQKHPWDAVAAANRLAEACPLPDLDNPVTAPILARQGELEEELEVYLSVYNGTAKSFNKVLGRPIVRNVAQLLKWSPWEELNFNPHNIPRRELSEE